MQYYDGNMMSFSDDNAVGGGKPHLRRCRIINAFIEKNNSALEEIIRDLCLTHILYPAPVRRGEETPSRYGVTFLNMTDKAYITEMHNNTYEDNGEPGRAVRAFKNLVLTEAFHSPKDFQDCIAENGGNIKTASGWYVTVTDVKPDGKVYFDGGMVIKASTFKSDEKVLSVWEIVEGAPSTRKEVRSGPADPNRGVKRLFKNIPASEQSALLENVTKTLYESYNVVGLNMLVNVLNKFVLEYNKDQCMINDPLRTAEVSLANYVFTYDDKNLTEYNKFVGGMRPLNGVGLILKFADGDKKNFIKMIAGSNMNSTKNKDVIGWGYREIYTHPITDNWLEHYNAGRKLNTFSEKESEKYKKMYGENPVNDETIDEIKELYKKKGGIDTLWRDLASHVIAQDLLNIYESSNTFVSLDDFENTLMIAKASCNGINKANMFELNNKLRSPADMELFNTFVNSSSFANSKPPMNSLTAKGASSKSNASGAATRYNAINEDFTGAKITLGRTGYIKEDSNSYLSDYLKAKSGIRGGAVEQQPSAECDEPQNVAFESDDEPEFKF